MLLYYVRHGDPIYDPDSLTPLGHKQAEALSKRLALYGLDEIYSSSSARAQMTAEPICKLLGKNAVLCDWAREDYAWNSFTFPNDNGGRSWGYQLRKIIELYNSPEIAALGDTWYDHPCFKDTNIKKGMLTVHDSVDGFMLSLGFKHDRALKGYRKMKDSGKRIALFAHEGFGFAFLSSLLDIPYPFFCTHFALSHSSMTVIHFNEKDDFIYPKILQHSNDSHLYKEGILTGYNNEINV